MTGMPPAAILFTIAGMVSQVALYVIYDQWYGIKYPFGKLDMVAIPDYEWGGMENTASIFYRDTALLLNEATASVFSRGVTPQSLRMR